MVNMINPLRGTNGQLMAMAAHSYCLGRQTYIVGACIDWMKAWWNELDDNTKVVIVRETMEALQDNLAGGSIDMKDWAEFSEWALDSLSVSDQEQVLISLKHRMTI